MYIIQKNNQCSLIENTKSIHTYIHLDVTINSAAVSERQVNSATNNAH